jgi:NitT/TauT family transport system substrate-binding protein
MKTRITKARLIGVILITVAILLVNMSCTSTKKDNSSEKRSLNIGMVTFAGYAPLYLAKEKGFFGNLDVHLNQINEVASIRAAMESGALDAYLATLDIALDINSEPPGVAVWAIDESSGGDGVVISGEIKDLSDLRGKTVAAEPGLPPNFVFLYILNKNGLSIKDVKFQDMTTQNAATAFISGSVEGAGLYEPYLSQAAKARANSHVVISSADVPGMIVDLIFVDDDVAKTRSQDIFTLIAGWNKALEFIHSSPDESNRIMAQAFGLDIGEFVDIVSGIRWLSVKENEQLLGTESKPGTIYETFDVVLDVLKHNRPAVYDSKANKNLTSRFVR